MNYPQISKELIMNLEELDIYLRHINIFEKKQRETGISVNDISSANKNINTYIDSKFNIFRFPKSLFFSKGENIYINKHNRFAPMIEHLHDFIEMTYIYSGTCTQTINGKTVNLTKGSLCVLDRDVPHSIDALGEDDIMINILINEETFSSLFLFRNQNLTSLEANILADVFNKQTNHDRYVIFDTTQSIAIHSLIQLLLTEYWSYQHQGSEFLSHYIHLIMLELVRIYSINATKNYHSSKIKIHEILAFIDNNFRNLKLETLARHFGYNPTYLSNTLKKSTGKNFQEILLERRLMQAADLLKSTDFTMDTIAFESGFSSTSYFFRQFKKYYNRTPKVYRKEN